MQCAVWNCVNERKNKEAKKSFFVFPKDEKLREKWLEFCGRPAGFKLKTWRICMDHFKKEDIVGGLAFEMGLREKRSLVHGAVPCIYHNISPTAEEELKKLQKKERKREAESTSKKTTVLTRSEESSTMTNWSRPGLTIRKVTSNASIPVWTIANVTPNNASPKTSVPIKIDVASGSDEVHEESVHLAEIQSLRIQIEKLKRENFELLQLIRRQELRHQDEKSVLKQKIAKVELEKKNVKEPLLGSLPAKHINIEVIDEHAMKSVIQQNGAAQNMGNSSLGIVHKKEVKMEIVDENSEEDIDNMQKILTEDTIEKQLLGILSEEQIKIEFIEKKVEADLEKDLMQQELARQNIMKNLKGMLYDDQRKNIFQEYIEETPLEIKTEHE
ncbi:PREDICTED: THAP domain-containing protein 5-like isoform X1 [Rhagoletis zephyria]|uniref:THAP domain-containing protein 5-like isoform X1 n=2 Tax=Rhagoletis zephyria TaxID=28612 RepID=UPI000811728C|nr:PREDICTED: THAP domain-containing protein 5-like isoform X1 [Rhagoletis zephyria]